MLYPQLVYIGLATIGNRPLLMSQMTEIIFGYGQEDKALLQGFLENHANSLLISLFAIK